MPTLTETKLKREGEVTWCGVNVIIADVLERERAREGVAILLNDVWNSALLNLGRVRSRILWIKLKISRVKVCVVVGYGLCEGDGEGSGTTSVEFWIV